MVLRNLSSFQQTELTAVLGTRINYDLRERMLYAGDVGTMPGIISPLAGNRIPRAIVQPVNLEEVLFLTNWAVKNRIPLVARGKATSGYGGVIPLDAGVVVEFNRMKDIAIDVNQRTVTVQPGAVWQKIEDQLNPAGLTLKSYPTSAPSSTVGGWLATGGAGIGSYATGYFKSIIQQVTLVRPDGKLADIKRDDLDTVIGASGTTGFITSITFKVNPLKVRTKRAYALSSQTEAAAFVQGSYARHLPLWSLSFVNPAAVHFKNLIPLKKSHNSKGTTRTAMPEKYIVLVVYDSSAEVDSQLEMLARETGAEMLDSSAAEHEWEERFSPMKAKRLAPSFIPAEVIVPADRLKQVLRELESKIKLPLLLEGFAVQGGDIVLLGFIPHDERKFGFNLAFGLSLTILKIAWRNGGRPYGTGLYFSEWPEQVLGAKAVKAIEQFKNQYDRANIMNPGKVTQQRMVAKMLTMAMPFEPIIRIIAGMNKGNEPGETYIPRRGLPGDITWFSYACAGCGYCVDECTQYSGRGWESQSPRGKWNLLKMVADGQTDITQSDVSTFLSCTTCDICTEKCQLELPIEPSWFKLRGQLVQDEGYHTLPAFQIMAASAHKERNIWAHYSKDRDAWVPDDIRSYIKEKSDIAYFPGCTASFVEQDIAVSTARLLKKAGVEFSYLAQEEACCGIPMLMSGKWDVFEEIMEHNMAAMKARGATTIITSCPACRLVWETFYKRFTLDRGEEYPFTAKHYSEVIAEKIADGSFVPEHGMDGAITYHDPCHMGRAGGIYEPPRELLKSVPGIDFREMEYNRDKAHCCGSVLTLVENPDTAAQIGKIRLDEAVAAGADTIITACPCCRVQLQATADYYKMDNLKVKDMAAFMAESCGLEVKDSTPVINERWATFDVMIRMMTPSGMAAMMAEMLDDMINAMPRPMAAMMRWLKRQPQPVKKPMLKMMVPVMPKLFSLLLPGMMPKVMPKMLEMVKAQVPMPDFMAEQLPDLMPGAMLELMPKMLPEILPHFMPLMIDYLMK
ncbi:MAG TPA: FAD-binding oxidoreductase [Syntrophomonas sp.]|jgi:Fe-S oxidoreductase/FAD/FMN-containing dehydrogenase|nr:FAD-binding oxidoreductase [Syntrophomonas sp.]HCF70509.1 FAD-binding oxidoreductase [Syntrophomonas sp.]